ncbi:alpha/beta fold hydrolase [Paenibacillus solisilvae]|uniref:Alpha/beta fold hydrolase n=1 Tax=Paenibacillus solisilvae TaxID=2486751 RepID=A0ABW0W2M4_9BACL
MPFFHIEDVSIHYREQGAGQSAIVCLHPPCITGQLFDTLGRELEEDHHILSLDIRGHGSSEEGHGTLTHAMIAEDTRQLLDELNIKKAYLCGYGAGSFPVLAALLAYPERFSGGILISGMAEYRDILTRSNLQASFISSALKAKETIVKRAVRQEVQNKASYAVLSEDALQGDSVKWREYASACLNASFNRELSQIKHPMLLVYGTADKISRDYAEQLYRHLPNAELYGVQRASRQLLTDEPIKTAMVIKQWMAKQEQPEMADTYEERQQLLEELVSHGVQDGMNGIGAQELR